VWELTPKNSHFEVKELVAYKKRSSVNSGAGLRRFDDVAGVEKSCLAKSKKGKKVKGNVVSLQLNICFPQTWNTWMFTMFTQLLKPLFLSPNRCETQITKNYQTSK